MPRVKIDYVVSFSSESPDAPASNLLANDAGKARWLCPRGEASCSVLLQLTRAVQISSITIGAHLSALVEVLVGKSETPNEPFQVLVASSVFLSPVESRRVTEGDAAADRVRSFNTDQLAADVRTRRWDRVRVVCSQPYNKHCKYGLSFIHIFSPESDSGNASGTAVAKPAINISLALDPPDSDDDEFRPGALFAQHRASQSSKDSQDSQETTATSAAQIRQAMSNAIKNLWDPSSKIVRTPIAKPRTDTSSTEEKTSSDRRRERLMYADEDDKPHDKIDKLVAAHKHQQAKTSDKNKDDKHTRKDKDCTSVQDKQEATSSKHGKDKTRERDNSQGKNDTHRKDRDKLKSPDSNKRDRSFSKQGKDGESSSKKQKLSRDQDTGSSSSLHAGPVSDGPHTLLKDVVFVLSGYENPRRAAVRDAALAMGARFQRDWGPDCTHLICAFPNTPKLKTVRSSPNGKAAVVVTAEWIERCAARCRRLPWQWFATETKLRMQRARSASGEDPPWVKNRAAKKARTPDSECDTDDEIERALQKEKKRSYSPDNNRAARDTASTTKQATDEDIANSSHESDVAFVMDERIKGNVTVSDSDTDDTEPGEQDEDSQDVTTVNGLPSFFEGQTFALHGSTKPLIDEALVRRYVRAYGGEIVEANEDEDIEVDYVVCLGGSARGARARARGRRVRADWLWSCHRAGAVAELGEFALA